MEERGKREEESGTKVVDQKQARMMKRKKRKKRKKIRTKKETEVAEGR